MNYHFNENTIPADMTEGDAIDLARLTAKASGLRAHIARRNRAGLPATVASKALDATRQELRAIATRYA